MTDAFAGLRAVSLFEGVSDDDLARLADDIDHVHLPAGEVLFHEGDWGDRAYVVTSGKVEIIKASARRDVLLAVRDPGDVIGEMALLQQEPRSATVRARTDVDFLAISREALDDVLETSPRAARAIFETFVRRLKANNEQLRQTQRMSQLGTLTAGVAHELNNPAAAVVRAAERLRAEVDELVAQASAATSDDTWTDLLELLGAAGAPPTDPLARGDAEDEVETWLEAHGVDAAWELAPDLVDAGASVAELDAWDAPASDVDLAAAIRLASAASGTRRTADVIAGGAKQLSEIVGALKSYTYLDRAPVQDVDVHQGIENTLVLLAHVTRDVRIVRDFADSLPTITALGTELNQVWTNLIDNACDALEEVTDQDPTLVVRTRSDADTVVVEFEDNGIGIPEEVQDQVFDAFFTTKPPGVGTGLGLHISYRIVVLEHAGDLTVESRPGRTVFRVTLPTDSGLQPPTDGPGEADAACEHLDAPMRAERPGGGCEACIANGDQWVELRFCNTCGQVGCCDESPNRHARRHAQASGHPVIRSLTPDENWAWCQVDEVGRQLRADEDIDAPRSDGTPPDSGTD